MAIKLKLGGELNNWEKFKGRKRNKAFLDIRAKIFRCDQGRCCFCSYQGEALEIINYDGNYQHNIPKNLITACVFCARCTLLDFYKLDYIGNDRIIYLPELPQAQLNTLCRILFCEMGEEAADESTYNAKTILAQLLDRGNFLDEKAGCKLSHPGLFLYYLNGQNKNESLISKLRWLPDAQGYEDAIKIWKMELGQ